MEPIPILQFPEMEVSKNPLQEVSVGNKCLENLKIKIDFDDIQPELDYWNYALICYVVVASPPSYVMAGFIRRIWRNMGVDKVVVIGRVFLLLGLQL